MSGLLTNAASRAWLVVAAVGGLVVVVVLGLSLFPRLSSGQDVIDDLGPGMTEQRIAGARAGIDSISSAVDLVDPLMTDEGGAAGEVPKLVALVADGTNLSSDQVVALLRREAPRTEALLRALPLSGVARELDGLVAFLAQTLDRSPEEMGAVLEDDLPRLAQSIAALPIVTQGWNEVPDIGRTTRFDGKAVRSLPDVRDYFSGDVVPVLERQGENFRDLEDDNGVGYIPYLLLALGLVVLLFGLAMAARSRRRPAGRAIWAIVPVVGLVIVALVFVQQLFPRLDGGDELLDDAKPAFTEERVAGSRAGIDHVSSLVDLADPITLAGGGAAAEVTELVALVAEEANLSEAQVLAALDREAPRTTGLLQAIPLRGIADEVPHLAAVLSEALGIGGDELIRTLREETPAIAQAILTVGPATAEWDAVPGSSEMTRFDGEPVRTVPTARDYFNSDLIPVVERQRENFDELESTWPPVTVFAPLLLVVGLIVVLYGGFMTLRAGRR